MLSWYKCSLRLCRLAVWLLKLTWKKCFNTLWRQQHCVQSKAGKPGRCTTGINSSLYATESPAFPLPAALWPIHLPDLWPHGWETAAAPIIINTLDWTFDQLTGSVLQPQKCWLSTTWRIFWATTGRQSQQLCRLSWWKRRKRRIAGKRSSLKKTHTKCFVILYKCV